MREPNSHECLLTGTSCKEIEAYEDVDLEILIDRGRVKMLVDANDPDFSMCQDSFEIDLEDLLKFSAINCRGIYERVLKETKEGE